MGTQEKNIYIPNLEKFQNLLVDLLIYQYTLMMLLEVDNYLKKKKKRVIRKYMFQCGCVRNEINTNALQNSDILVLRACCNIFPSAFSILAAYVFKDFFKTMSWKTKFKNNDMMIK